MKLRFVLSMLLAFMGAIVALGGIGYGVSSLIVPAPRDVYRNMFFEFDLAPGWWCHVDGTEQVCYPDKDKPHGAIAVIAMKYRNKDDTLAAYEAHLRQPQPVGAPPLDGRATPLSEVRYVKRRVIGGREWVESLHVGSEIADMLTYYAGTATSQVGILVTMTVHKDRADARIKEFGEMLGSLRTYQRGQ